jgi:hypothetical protein
MHGAQSVVRYFMAIHHLPAHVGRGCKDRTLPGQHQRTIKALIMGEYAERPNVMA